MKIKLKRKFEGEIRINDRSDLAIFLGLFVLSLIVYFNLSDRSLLVTMYLISLLWYLFGLYNFCRVKWFSGVGLYIIYLLVYVQYAVMMNGFYSYYTSLNSKTVYIIVAYNIIAPIALIPFNKISNFKKTELKNVDVQENWISAIFYAGVAAMFLFYLLNGSIPVLSPDAENARVTAMQGKGFLVVIATTCFLFAMSLSKVKRKVYIYLVVGCLLMFGTGYRSQLLTIILIFFLTNIVGRGKKFMVLGVITVLLILGLYAWIGSFRRGTAITISKMYLPVLWRFFVNFDNFDVVVNEFPLSQLQFGKTLLNDLSVILPGHQETYMMQLKDILNKHFDGGSMTPSIFGEGYYNWGGIGAVAWPILMLFFISLLDRHNKRRFPGGLYYLVSFQIAGVATSGFMTVMTNSYLPSLVMLAVILWLNKRYKLVLNHNFISSVSTVNNKLT